MGGAERNARKRKQQRAAVGRAAAASGGGNKATIAAVVAVVVLAVGVIGGIIVTNQGEGTTGQAIPAADGYENVAHSGERDGAAVTRGAEDAEVTIDVYEDFLCPYCGQFEEQFGDPINERVEAGELRVRYHPVPLLNKASDPPGYSLDAANASLCAADEGEFVPYHASLFAEQPKEGGEGYDNSQLVELGRNVGITGEQFAGCVNNDEYDQQINTAFNEIVNNPDLKQQGRSGEPRFATPTVVANGQIVNWSSNPNWLSGLLGSGGQ